MCQCNDRSKESAGDVADDGVGPGVPVLGTTYVGIGDAEIEFLLSDGKVVHSAHELHQLLGYDR